MHAHHEHNNSLVFLSIVIAIFASYTALDLVSSLSTSKGRAKWMWLLGGSLAMGVGIWSMHFIGMLAFRIHGIDIYYDVPLLILSIIVAVMASALALYLIASKKPSFQTYFVGSSLMGAAIAGMHYIGIASMRMSADIVWNWTLVGASLSIAFAASYAALFIAFLLRDDLSIRGFIYRGVGGALMGLAIAGMHYTGMAAMDIIPNSEIFWNSQHLLATDGLAAAIIIGTLMILGIALSGSNIDRALSRKTLMNEILQEGISVRDRFLSVASHELKTPLTSIKLQTELIIRLLSTGDMENSQIITLLQRTNANIDRINRLVDDMLDISRITSGKLKLTRTRANLKDVILEVIDRFKPQTELAKSEAIIFHAEDVVANLDVFRFEQVVNNLISNAIKYGDKKTVMVTLAEVEGNAVIEIKDQGLGIPEESLKKIFDRFERATNISDISGLGLGLFIVREIVTAHGGRIWVESEVNRGSTFFIELPLEELERELPTSL